MSDIHEGGRAGGPVKAPQDLAAGLFLIALALFAFWMTSNLNPGTLRLMGPGMLPRGVAGLIALTGVVLVIGAFLWEGPPIEALKLRGPFFIALGILGFGLTIRGFDIAVPFTGLSVHAPALGMLGAGPLAILISGFASHETKWGQLILFAIGMTIFCLALFKGVSIPTAGGWTTYGLNLPIPLAPFLLGY